MLLRHGALGCLLAGIFFLPLSLDVATILLIGALFFLAAQMAWTGEVFLRRTKLDPWLAGFVFFAAASTPGSIFAYESWYNFYHLISLFVLVYLLVTQTTFTAKSRKWLVIAILASASVVCLYGLFQYTTGVDVTAERWIDGEQFPQLKTRIFSTLGNPNVLAAFLVMTSGISCGWSMETGYMRGKRVLMVLTMLEIFCLVLTYSRGAWLAVGIMAFIAVAVGRKLSRRVFLGGFTVLSVLGVVAYDTLKIRLLSILDMFNSADSSVALRWALWESTTAMIQEHPWLGIGWGTYPYVYPYYDFFVQNESVTIHHAHNSLLNIAAEVGIPGMLCFAIACGLTLAKMIRHLRQNTERDNGLQFGIILAMTGLAAFSMTDHVLFNIQVAAVFWALLAIAAGMPENRNEAVQGFWVKKKIRGWQDFFLHDRI